VERQGVSKKAIAATACQLLGLDGYAVSAHTLPSEIHQLDLIRCLWEREWQMHQRVLLLDCDASESQSGEKEAALLICSIPYKPP
jgi:hypothetical protein